MIIYMCKSDKVAAEQLALLSSSGNEVIMLFSESMNYQGITDDHLTLVDLSAKSTKQRLLRRGVLVNFLDKPEMPIPATVKTIDLLYSDVESKYGLAQEAYDTSAYFRDKYNREVTVRYVSNVEKYHNTVLVPPGVHVDSDINDNPGWRLYGFTDKDLVNVESNDDGITIGFDGFLKILNERKLKPYWEGYDIRDYLAKDDHMELARPVHKDESPPSGQRSEDELQISSSESSVVPEYKRSMSPFFAKKESKRTSFETRDADEQPSKYPRVVKDEAHGKLTIIMPLSPESEKLAEDFCRKCHALINQTVSTISGKAPT